MKKFIVTTTINSPTKATIKFCQLAQEKDWNFVVVGDTKTPHEEYKRLEKHYPFTYLDPKTQEANYKQLSDTIGWKSIQRRNIGFVYAYEHGADIVATVDDDNIPYDEWGDNIYVNQQVEVDLYQHKQLNIFDPLSATNHNDLWHRGYPVDLVPDKNNIEYLGKKTVFCKVQADFWDGDPDIDAMCRLTRKPIVKFDRFAPFTTANDITVFNSQNTFIARELLKYYSVLPHVGRMDDIWGAYILQKYMEDHEHIVFCKPTVYQDRNEQDLVTNLENEVIGYRNTLKLIESLLTDGSYEQFLPEKTQEFFNTYQKQFN